MSIEPDLPRLLVVDDVDDNRAILSRRFGRLGYEVHEAENGERALEMIAVQPFDVVLLDIMMPGIDGLEVLQQVRETYSQEQLPVIMVSAKSLSEDVVDALLMGANDYITKPVDLKVAQARVEAQLTRKRANDAARAAQRELERSLKSLRGALATPDAAVENAGALKAKLDMASAVSRVCERPGFEDMVELVDHSIDLLRQLMTTPEPELPPGAGANQGISILSIDAEAQDRDVVRQMLFQSARTVEVVELSDAAAGEAIMQGRRFDLVIMGWRKSGGQSAGLIRALRTREAKSQDPRTPIVALSDQRDDAALAMEAGADLHLVKPLTAAGLLNAAVTRLSETPAARAQA